MPVIFDPFLGKLATIGVPLAIFATAPTTSDYNYAEGTIAIVPTTDTAYILIDVTGSVATWVTLANPGGVVTDIVTDSGTAVPAAGIINLLTGPGVSTSATGNTITINVTDVDWTVITAATQTIVEGNGYIANRAGNIVFTLPAAPVLGSSFQITGMNTALGWTVGQPALQQIFFGTSSTTVGIGGSVSSTATRDSIRAVCVVGGASAVWNLTSAVGSLLFV